jgi:hypothetical protein
MLPASKFVCWDNEFNQVFSVFRDFLVFISRTEKGELNGFRALIGGIVSAEVLDF